MEFSLGQIVFSKCGRDKADAFVVMGVEGEFLFLADGKKRPIAKAKKKKIKHTQPTKQVDVLLKEKIEQKSYILDSDVRKALQKYNKTVFES